MSNYKVGPKATIMVTGAAGFIGSHLAIELAQQGYTVYAVDCFLNESYSSEVKRNRFYDLSKIPNIHTIEQDLRERTLPALPRDSDVIINEAGMPGLMKSWEDFSLYVSCNLQAVDNLMQFAIKSNVARFVQISTSSVYGRDATGDEGSETNPVSPYGVSKLAAEKLVFAYLKNFNVPAIVLRYFSVYGPGQRPDMAFYKFIEAGMRGDEIEVFGDGFQSRTNTFVSDCVSGTVKAMKDARVGETYNISGNQKLALNSSLEIIEGILGTKLKIKHLPGRPGDQRETFGAIYKASDHFGYLPTVNPIEGLQKQIEWHLRERSKTP